MTRSGAIYRAFFGCQNLFGTQPLPLKYWFIALAVSAGIFVLVEIEKRLTRGCRTSGGKVMAS